MPHRRHMEGRGKREAAKAVFIVHPHLLLTPMIRGSDCVRNLSLPPSFHACFPAWSPFSLNTRKSVPARRSFLLLFLLHIWTLFRRCVHGSVPGENGACHIFRSKRPPESYYGKTAKIKKETNQGRNFFLKKSAVLVFS